MIRKLQGFLRWFFCSHFGTVEFERNIYGDEINHRGGMRSPWRCTHCGESIARESLYLGRQDSRDAY